MENAAERREQFLLAALESSGDPVKALAHARAMEDFIVNGLEQLLLLPPPRAEAGAVAIAPAVTDVRAGGAPIKRTRAAAAPETPAAAKVRRPAKWTPERVEAFADMWNAGKSASDIGERFGVKPGSVYQFVHHFHLPSRRPKKTASPPAVPGLPAAAKPNGSEPTDTDGVVRFLQSRDIHVRKDPNSIKRPRWLVEGLRDQALTADELLNYANKERRRCGQPTLIYGL